MSRYRIEIKQSAAKEIRGIGPKKDRKRVVNTIGRLAENPRPTGCRKLAGREAYRLRVGRYRIVYTVQDSLLVVYVVRVGHRKEIYRP